MSITRWVRDGKSGKISKELEVALDWLVCHFQNAGPRVILGARSERPVLVFTDGACEPEGTTVGGVIYDAGRTPECFGAKLPDGLVAEWRTKQDQLQVIGQAEIYPLLVARLTWCAWLRGRRVIYFVDNEAARIGLVRAFSPVLPSMQLILQCLGWDYEFESQGWYARVPSYSNIADDPSRLVHPPDSAGIIVVPPVFPRGHSADVVL